MLTPDHCDVEIDIKVFNAHATAGNFSVGPFQEVSSKEYGAPYIRPDQFKLFGQLKTGERVWSRRTS